MKHFVFAVSVAAMFALTPAALAQHEGNAFLAAWDTNRDGQVARPEYDAARTARFSATDTNGDGWVSDAEYLAEYRTRLEQELAASDRSEEKKAEERQRQIRQTGVRFNALDIDKDAKMQKAEYDASGARIFERMDADKDGVVTATDFAAVAARVRSGQ